MKGVMAITVWYANSKYIVIHAHVEVYNVKEHYCSNVQ